LLAGFFLAGLVIHGGLQAWWIEPVLKRLDKRPLSVGATIHTAFNDNAAMAYLATLVPGFTDALKCDEKGRIVRDQDGEGHEGEPP
jgi:hypothetical protein